MKVIALSRGLEMKVDDEDYEWMSRHPWYARPYGDGSRPVRRAYCAVRRNGSKKVRAHREVMGVTDPQVVVDHIDGDTLNNCRSNLRVCTQRENLWNQHPRAGSALRGIRKAAGGWYLATLHRDGERYVVGYFPTQAEAIAAWNAASRSVYGEFGYQQRVPD